MRTVQVAAVVAALVGAPYGPGSARGQSLESWRAPDAARLMINPLSASPDNLKKGRALFSKHCVMCHGDKGRGDGPTARLHARRSGHAPRDLSRLEVQAGLSDGEMFWKVGDGWRNQGRIIMPGVGEEVSPEDRWRLVLYVRSLRQTGERP